MRQGDTFAAYDSPDGVDWNLITITSISMAQTVYAGLAVCAFNNGRLSAATFDNLSVVAQADLSAAFNQTGAVSDGTPFAGGLDGNGDAYSATLLGSMLPANGYDFNLGAANGANAVQATGQTVSLPAGQFSVLSFLGTGVNGPQPGQTFVVNYADGSSDTFAVDMSDWLSPQGYMGEAIAAALSYYDWLDGSPVAVTNYLYQYSLIVNNQQTVSSIALPANGNVVILAIDLNVLGPAGQPPFASPHGPSAGRISALVPEVQNRNPWATAAGMFREGGAPFADVLVIPGNCAAFAGRHTPSKRPANANVTGQVDPSPAATDRAGITPTAWTPHRRAEVLDVVLAELDNGVSLVERECDQ